MRAKLLSGEPNGTVLIATDGYRVEVVDVGVIPDWAKLYWYLKEDPRVRPDWNRVVGYKPEKFNKISKSDQ